MALSLTEISTGVFPDAYRDEPCILCGKEVKNPRYWVHVCLHCDRILMNDGERCPDGYDEDGEGGCGWFAVGPDCIKRVPKEYRF